MEDEYKVMLGAIFGILLTVIVVVTKLSHNFLKNADLIAQQTTCYGKVLQQSWDNDGTKINALAQCDGF